ncbi:MAG: signal peptidase II [Clostridia bacterium]|nr:signal peptidase II [Clostridia bacterium]
MKKIHYIIIVLFLILLILDQTTKILFMNKNIEIIPNVLKFTYTENTGRGFWNRKRKLCNIYFY